MRALMFSLLVLAGGAAGADAAPVRVQDAPGRPLTLDNGLVSVDVRGSMIRARSADREFIRLGHMRNEAHTVTVVDARGPLGEGKAVELCYRDGGRDRIALYPNVPFVCFQQVLANSGDGVREIDRITPVTLTLRVSRLPKEMRVLGCDGLTPADRERTSYAFLAAADPETRAGVVAGWLTHDRASGIVLCAPEGDELRLQGRSEYGKLRLERGQTAEGETFAVGAFADNLRGLEAFADAIAAANRVRLRPITDGYCTWYSQPHGRAADAEHLAQLGRFSAKELAPYGFKTVQIDDGWQLSRRDFTTWNPKGPYAPGMEPTAAQLRSQGLTAGIWLIPFGWDPKRPVFENHQDWFVHRPDGSLYEVTWAGTCLDMTHPGAQGLVRETVSRITRDWGYKYLKLDGLWTGLAAKILYPEPTYRDDGFGDAVFHNPAKTNVEAYRDGLQLVREAAGDEVFLLGCNIAQNMRTLGASYGRVDAMRVGRDIQARWEKIVPCMQLGTRLYFYHGRVWHNDPDCLMLREPLTLDQARAWASWIALSGQLNMVSEWLPGLPADRIEVLKRSMPNTGRCGRPVDLFEREDAAIWHLSSGPGSPRRDLVGLFNWGDKAPKSMSADLSRLDLPDAGKEGWVGFDYWANRFLGPVGGRLEGQLPPSSCRVIALRPAADHPQVVSTSRHISQGMVDLLEERWQPAGKTLAGRSRVVGGDPYELRLSLPAGAPWQVAAVEVAPEDRQAGVTFAVRPDGPHARVTLTSPSSREVRWQVRF